MGKLVLVTGPARSGKSEWAETLVMESGKAVIYIATAMENPTDIEWQRRIEEHRKRRPQNWTTLLVPMELSATLRDAQDNSSILVDSLGTWVANLLEQDDHTWLCTLAEFLATVPLVAADVVFVAEETGWGVVPAYPMGRQFRDRLGNLVRHLGAICQPVYLVTGGHVLNLSVLGTAIKNH